MAFVKPLQLFCTLSAFAAIAAGAPMMYDKKVSSLSCMGSYAPEYIVKVVNYWTENNHPMNYPASNAHTSPGNIVSHNSEYTVFGMDIMASMGMKNVAEKGNPTVLRDEFMMKMSEGSVLDSNLAPILWWTPDVPDPAPANLVTDDYAETMIKVDAYHTQISWAHMLAPSPDWFTGFAGLDLCYDGMWLDEITIKTDAYDAGTDCGMTYTAADMACDPVMPISKIMDGDLEYNGMVKPVAKFVITRKEPVMRENQMLSKLSCMGSYPLEYTVKLTNYWREDRHPTNFPAGNAHTSPGQLVSHSGYYEMFNTDMMASMGVQSVAETGNPMAIQEEFMTAKDDDKVLDTAEAPILWWTPDVPDPAPANLVTSEMAEMMISVDKYHSLISYAHMLAPSPDWFTGFYGLDLCQDGMWLDEVTVWTPAYDAGTDCGMTYTADNMPCDPTMNIYEIMSGDLSYMNSSTVMPVAKFVITRNKQETSPSVPFAKYELSDKPCTMPMKFDVMMTNYWTSHRHPNNYPYNAHTSPGNLVSHGMDYSLFRAGSMVSKGMQEVAETGNPMTVQSEFAANVLSGSVLEGAQGQVLWWGEGRPAGVLDSQEDKLSIRVDYHHPMVSWAHMLAPSPDWFTGFYDVNLCVDGYWVEKAVLETPPYDAGTDCGTTYMAEDMTCDPTMDIYEIDQTTGDLATVNSVAKFDIKMTSMPDSCTPDACCKCERWSCRRNPYGGNCRAPGLQCALNCNDYCVDKMGEASWAVGAEEKLAETADAHKISADTQDASRLDAIFHLSVAAVALLAVVLLGLVVVAMQTRRRTSMPTESKQSDIVFASPFVATHV